MTLALPRICPTCQVAWTGAPPCWSCGQPVRTTATSTVANAAGPNSAHVGVPLNL